MRIYKDFKEALNEVARDLKEMGIRVYPKTYQDKDISDNPDFHTLELQNYVYMVTRPHIEDLNPTLPWASAEWRERKLGIEGTPLNPGQAWRFRPEVWQQFLEDDGKFAYSYGDRFSRNEKVLRIIERIKVDPDSRQLWLNMWDDEDITKIGGVSRVPCTLGYQFLVRGGQLHMTYIMRSADFATHFNNDLYLASLLQQYVATKSGYPVGRFTHMIGSLHVYQKDVQSVF